MWRGHSAKGRDGAVQVARIDFAKTAIERGPHAEETAEIDCAGHSNKKRDSTQTGAASPGQLIQCICAKEKQWKTEVAKNVRIVKHRPVVLCANQRSDDWRWIGLNIVQPEMKEIGSLSEVHEKDNQEQAWEQDQKV